MVVIQTSWVGRPPDSTEHPPGLQPRDAQTDALTKGRPTKPFIDQQDDIRNNLLAALPAPDRHRIVPALEVVPLKLKAFVHKAGEPVQDVYFPAGGFLSVVTVLEDGGMVEVATIGREGAAGVPAALDGSVA